MKNEQEQKNYYNVIRIAQTLLDQEPRDSVTASLIAEKVDVALALDPRWGDGLNKGQVVDELIRRFSLWVGGSAILKSEDGHKDWLSSARKRDWRYWQRYRQWMEQKLSSRAVDSLDENTDEILSLLEDPLREGSWDRRGLVVGHVQSGKTGNYTGLICKAADAQYKIIIVLAGLHNNLRAQTQSRLDEGFLGFETSPLPDGARILGVGEIDRDPAIRPNYATNRLNNGDFSTCVARNLGISPEQRPWLFVVKKNKTVLERLLRWIKNHVADAEDPETRARIVTKLPLLLIDDEADHASVDTGEQVYDSDGNPDEEHLPTTINRLIRRILSSFSRKAYVGYTATPFANIFIHEQGRTREEGPDLFPSSFIINLGAPSTYIGPAKIFGLDVDEADAEGLPLVRAVEDYASTDGLQGWMPQNHKNTHQPFFDGAADLPDSLKEAIDAFVLACAVRNLRGQGQKHSSMLIHVTRYNNVQKLVVDQVDQHVRHMRQRLQRHIDDFAIAERLRGLYVNDFVPSNALVKERDSTQATNSLPSWDDIKLVLPDIVADIQIKTINGTAKDVLDYEEHKNTGLKVIAIGGDKLARGLTLEGLCTSYFLRASKMYDTLMQMGRWFGYRPGYLDVCRLYTTHELIEWFSHITSAAEELREEFDLMVASGSTPRQYGLKVQSHPVLMITSRLKMRSTKNLMLSFSGLLLETIALHRNSTTLNKNYLAACRFLRGLGTPEINPKRFRGEKIQQWTGCLWKQVPWADVVDFLTEYETHSEAYKVRGALISEFIRSMATVGELTEWTVVLVGAKGGEDSGLIPDVEVGMLERQSKTQTENRYSIGRLMSPRDESIDLDDAAWNAALDFTKKKRKSDPARMQNDEEPQEPNGPAIRWIKGFGAEGVSPRPESGLLLIYALDPAKTDSAFEQNTPPIIAFGASFPQSHKGVKVEYRVNSVEWMQWEKQYGSSE
ncbi:MAG: Z1 domain-containing protein [Alphaproteobacteria bacterium]|nr:Z1 domain-containing protein [Alphaproteobacteria bacterium]